MTVVKSPEGNMMILLVHAVCTVSSEQSLRCMKRKKVWPWVCILWRGRNVFEGGGVGVRVWGLEKWNRGRRGLDIWTKLTNILRPPWCWMMGRNDDNLITNKYNLFRGYRPYNKGRRCPRPHTPMVRGYMAYVLLVAVVVAVHEREREEMHIRR